MNKGRWRGGEAAAATDESANLTFFFFFKQRIAFERKHYSPMLQKKLRIRTAPHFHRISHHAGLTHLGKKMTMLDRTATNAKHYYHLLNKQSCSGLHTNFLILHSRHTYFHLLHTKCYWFEKAIKHQEKNPGLNQMRNTASSLNQTRNLPIWFYLPCYHKTSVIFNMFGV